MLNRTTKVITAIIILTMTLGGMYILNQKNTNSSKPSIEAEESAQQIENPSPQIVSTNPSPLTDTIILPNQVIEITFNYPLIDEFETRIDIEPKIKYKLEFVNDKKTLKIVPNEPYQGGRGYTLGINSETKFHNGQKFNKSESFSFRTLDYKGI